MSDHLPNRPSRPSHRPLVLCLALALAGEAFAADAAPRDPLAAFVAASDAGLWGRHLAPDAFAPFLANLRARIGARIGAPLTPARAPSVQAVGNCNDSGAGSFRDAVENAIDGDTVDMTGLVCSTISLSSGVVSHANNLTVRGPGPQLTIDAGHNGPAIFQYGAGLLAVSGVSMTNGAYGLGGCLVAVGSVSLSNVSIHDCASTGYAGYSDGGAVFAGVDLSVTSSTITNNDAYDASFSGFRAYGGGLFAHGNMTITASTLRSNAATAGGNYASGGGALSAGLMTINNSTLSLNSALDVGGNYALGGGAIGAGGIVVGGSTFEGNTASLGGGLSGGAASTAFIVINSSLTGNDAAVGGGIIALAPLSLFNSTVAFNYAGGGVAGGGIVIVDGATLQSSIVANNYAGTGCTARCRPANPLGGSNGVDLSANGNPVTIAGANNLVVNIDPAMTLPPGTLRIDPHLAPFLENNGGPTQTLALQSGSPAINAGNNSAGLSTDQRGAGFARTSGGLTDIGAFEVQSGGSGDPIFRSGFDGN